MPLSKEMLVIGKIARYNHKDWHDNVCISWLAEQFDLSAAEAIKCMYAAEAIRAIFPEVISKFNQ